MQEAARNKLFGTDGIRGIAGEYPLDEGTIIKIGRSLVLNLERDLGRPPRIVVGRDTRESGPDIEAALARGAVSAGARIVSAGVITTPGVAFITRTAGFDAGVVISASHNPYHDNGIKVFSPTGKKIADEMERRIEDDVAAPSAGPHPAESEAIRRQAPDGYESREAEYRDSYVKFLTSEVGGGLDLAGARVAADCANGAASEIAPEVFRRLGADLVLLSNAPDGRNINLNCGSLHIETLQRAVADNGLDLGIAFDGDADRALFVDGRGELVDGDGVLLLVADYLKSQGRLAGNLVVATVMSNIGLEIALRERGMGLVRTQVGDRYVLERLLEQGGSLGGEQSGHVIFPDISLAGDGIITAIEVLRVVRESGRSLGELASQMKRFPQVLVNVPVKSKPPLESISEVKRAMDELEDEMQGRGRLLVRYSGTENLARVMIEGESQARIQEQAELLAGVIRRAIG